MSDTDIRMPATLGADCAPSRPSERSMTGEIVTIEARQV
jgi:hypothetical protein